MTKTKDLMKKSADLTDYQPLHPCGQTYCATGASDSDTELCVCQVQCFTWNYAVRKKIKPTGIRGKYPLSLPDKKEKPRTREKDLSANRKKLRSLPYFDSKHHLTLQ